MDEVETTGEEPEGDDAEREGVGRFLYRLALAGVGSVVLAQEELSGLFKRSEEPAEASAEGEPLENPGANNEARGSTNVNATIDRVLHTFSLASRNDVDELTQKIDALAAKVAALRG